MNRHDQSIYHSSYQDNKNKKTLIYEKKSDEYTQNNKLNTTINTNKNQKDKDKDKCKLQQNVDKPSIYDHLDHIRSLSL
jgi:hypothetical protein